MKQAEEKAREEGAIEEEQQNAASEQAANETENESAQAEQSDATEEQIDEKDALIQELEEKLQEEENKLLRVLADFENFKRRTNLDKEALHKYKAQSVMTSLLPVLDNFERALSLETKTEEAQSMLTGIEMIYRNLVDSLKAEGLVEIEAIGKEFDPNFHQAVMTDNDPDKDSGIVLEEMQKGYMLKDRVLRPSMVKVNE
ncbi:MULTISPECIES: nucleotide exchange factor GrpE [Sporosarcina]|uniref:Protein GrpE n=1 Tax=Sporosarcina contaminans TaxID=633403 RepID=A0ABW3TU10_9BACL